MRTAKLMFLFVAAGFLSLSFLAGVTAWWYPLGKAPLQLQAWLPLPLVCVRWHCASYARWWKYHAGWAEEISPQESVRKLGEILQIEWAAREKGITLSPDEEEKARKYLLEALGRLGEPSKVAGKLYARKENRLWEDVWRPWLLKQKLSRLQNVPLPPPVRVYHRQRGEN
jgi:hypothetical protein